MKTNPYFAQLAKKLQESPKEFVVLFGSGLSCAAGFPDWQGLKDLVIVDAEKSAKETSGGREKKAYYQELNAIKSIADLWESFSRLSDLLGRERLLDFVEHRLEGNSAKPGRVDHYEKVWRLNIKGAITFNLDRLAANALARTTNKAPMLATGHEPEKYQSFHLATEPFLIHAHGQLGSSRKDWVFTREDLSTLFASIEYKKFFGTTFHSKHVLIFGLSVHDIAIQTLLHESNSILKSTPSCFAFVADTNQKQLKKYLDFGIRPIPYTSDNDHAMLADGIDYLAAYKPEQIYFNSAYTGGNSANSPDMSPDEVRSLSISDARMHLNARLASILTQDHSPTIEDQTALGNFYVKYLRAINDAWLVSANTGYDELFGYKITRSLGHGAFGNVYEAQDSNGCQVAIKVLRSEYITNSNYTNSFRRGVYTMRLLAENNAPRIVKFITAYEVPAAIVMEFVNGPTLSEAITNRTISTPLDALNALRQVGEAISAAHKLDVTILHRDIKPDNIILRDYWSSDFDIDAVVLDYDLSWHEGASALSVVHGMRAHGYAAPEQLNYDASKPALTRSTAVDAYGYGMLCYFVLTGNHPRVNQHAIPDFEIEAEKEISVHSLYTWKSMPRYLASLICKCTLDRPRDRIAFSDAVDAINRCYRIITNQAMDSTNPMLLFELASAIDNELTVTIQSDLHVLLTSRLDPSKRIELRLELKGSSTRLYVAISKSRSSSDDRNITKYFQKSAQRALSKLDNDLFFEKAFDEVQGGLMVKSCIVLGVEVTRTDITRIGAQLAASRSELSFEKIY